MLNFHPLFVSTIVKRAKHTMLHQLSSTSANKHARHTGCLNQKSPFFRNHDFRKSRVGNLGTHLCIFEAVFLLVRLGAEQWISRKLNSKLTSNLWNQSRQDETKPAELLIPQRTSKPTQRDLMLTSYFVDHYASVLVKMLEFVRIHCSALKLTSRKTGLKNRDILLDPKTSKFRIPNF